MGIKNTERMQCNIYYWAANVPRKNDKFMFPHPPPPLRSLIYSCRNFYQSTGPAQRKLDRNVFTRLFIKPSTGKKIRSIYTASTHVCSHNISSDNIA